MSASTFVQQLLGSQDIGINTDNNNEPILITNWNRKILKMIQNQ